jgi:hypothetical protein
MSVPKLPVFRLVEGKLIRVPGDVRDPKRRYASTTNVQTGESYLREFTDEEERQRDAEEAAWEAGQPQREAEAKRREIEAEQFRQSLEYEARIVAFLDVMGWAAAIAASANSVEVTKKLGIAVQGLNAHVQMIEWQRKHGGPSGWPGDPMMTQFSDSLLISFVADRDAKSHLEMTLSAVVLGLMFNGFVVRGAVAYGPMIHREALAYGPAMVAAYELEQKSAIDPRIILSSALADAWGTGEPVHDRNGALLGHRRLWRQDDDGVYFFDHLSNPVGMFMLDQQEPPTVFRDLMGKWRTLIVERMEQNRGNPSVVRKYAWLARYFNRECAENPGGHIEAISLPS